MITFTNNGSTEYIIIRGENASPSEITAANNLQNYLKQISGVDFPVLTDISEERSKEIIVGKTNREAIGEFDRSELGDDGFIIKTTGEKLWLVGGEQRGTLYSIYEFLEKYLGCRFFTKTLEVVPKKEMISISAIECDKQIPVFKFRDSYWFDYLEENISVKRKLNSFSHNISKENGGMIEYAGSMCHTMFALVPPEIYFDEHPEYYGLGKSGKREKFQLCLTNPDVLEIAKKAVRKNIEDHPEAHMVSVTQLDNSETCLCPECMKVYREEGGAYSGTMIRFVNAIADDIKDDYPNIKIDTFAYQYTRSKPAKVKPRENVIIRFCTAGACHSHVLDENYTSFAHVSNIDGSHNHLAEDITAWASISNSLYVWFYVTNFRNYLAIYPNFKSLRQNMKFFADNNVIGVFTQGAYQDKSTEFAELRAYILSKLLWNPYMSDEEYHALMDEFMEYYYGPGGKYISQYIALCDKESEDNHFGIFPSPVEYFKKSYKNDMDRPLPDDLTLDMIVNYENTDWSKYHLWYNAYTFTLPALTGQNYFDLAAELAENDFQRKNIAISALQIPYQISCETQDNLQFVKNNIRHLVNKYFEAHPDILPEDRQKILAVRCACYAEYQYVSKYIDMNEKLYESLKSLEISRVSEWFKRYGHFSFDKQPNSWDDI